MEHLMGPVFSRIYAGKLIASKPLVLDMKIEF